MIRQTGVTGRCLCERGGGGGTVTRIRGNRKACACDQKAIASTRTIHHILFSARAGIQHNCHYLMPPLPPAHMRRYGPPINKLGRGHWQAQEFLASDSALSKLTAVSGPCKGPPGTGRPGTTCCNEAFWKEKQEIWVLSLTNSVTIGQSLHLCVCL